MPNQNAVKPDSVSPDLWRQKRFRELDSIHRALFSAPASDLLLSRYLAAYEAFPYLRETADQVDAWLDGARDLETLEFRARLQNRANPLTRRFQTVSYLAEARADHLGFYVSGPSGRLGAWLGLGFRALRTAFKLLQGVFPPRALRER